VTSGTQGSSEDEDAPIPALAPNSPLDSRFSRVASCVLQSSKFPFFHHLKVLTNEKRGVLTVELFVRSRFKLFTLKV
jgi:hypothetical protein